MELRADRISQEIQYSKSKSDIVSKLDGSFRMPAAASGAVTSTALQQSIFSAPPAAISTLAAPNQDTANSPAVSVSGQKRMREEENESDEDVAMEEDSDDE